MDKFRKQLEGLFKSGVSNNSKHCFRHIVGRKKIIIYGAGDGFITFSVFVLKRFKVKPSIILDKKFKSKGIFHNIPTFSPKKFIPTEQIKKESIVIITVGKKELHNEIFDQLIKLGFENIVLATDIYEYHLLFPLKEIQEEEFRYYLKNKKQIISAFNLLKDSLSQEIFLRVLETHIIQSPVQIPNHPLSRQYFPEDIKLKKGCQRTIICGAYNGDTIRKQKEIFGKIDALALFEPDSNNFRALIKYLQYEGRNAANNIIALPCGVFKKESKLAFSDGDKINSAITKGGGIYDPVC